MEEGNKRVVFLKKDRPREEKGEVFSKIIRAGQRTYYFDVKSSPPEDFLVTITESKKRFNEDGRYFYERHKIFLYREDFEKFVEGLNAMFEFVQAQPLSEQPIKEREYDFNNVRTEDLLIDFAEPEAEPSYTNIDFEDLDEKR